VGLAPHNPTLPLDVGQVTDSIIRISDGKCTYTQMELWIVAFPTQLCPLNASGRFKASLLKLGGILFSCYVYAI
jgi:hypothetical protein